MPPSRTVAPYSPAWTPKRRAGYGSRAASGSFIRDTNLLERSLGEVNRRTKVIGRFPGETSCLSLVWAVLDLVITHATNGITFTQLDRQRLDGIRYQPAEPATAQEVTAT